MAEQDSQAELSPIRFHHQRDRRHIDELRMLDKENENTVQFCFECKKSLAKSPELINIAGQAHRWHPECFKCAACNQPLEAESSCHIYKDQILCRDDYAKLERDHRVKCARCRWTISASDWVRKAGQYVYHLACFSCDICMRQLSTGEQFTISLERKNAVRLLCRLHFAVEKQPHSPQAASASQEARMSSSPTLSFDFNYSQSPECSGNNQNNNNKFHTQRQQPQQVHNNSASFLHLFASTSTNNNNQNTDQQLHLINSKSDFQDSRQLVEDIQSLVSIQQRATTSGSASSSNCSTGGLLALQSKSKRVRTTFTEDQLSILQTHFQIDSNPDGQDLERIATITGLSKRVTQVWFQNSRARQKKYMIKRKPSASLAASSALATCSKLHSQHQQHTAAASSSSTRDSVGSGWRALPASESARASQMVDQHEHPVGRFQPRRQQW